MGADTKRKEFYMGIRDLGNGQWAADNCPGEVFYSPQAASEADQRSGSSSSSSSTGSPEASRSKITGLTIVGKILKVFWDFFADMFK